MVAIDLYQGDVSQLGDVALAALIGELWDAEWASRCDWECAAFGTWEQQAFERRSQLEAEQYRRRRRGRELYRAAQSSLSGSSVLSRAISNASPFLVKMFEAGSVFDKCR